MSSLLAQRRDIVRNILSVAALLAIALVEVAGRRWW